MTNRIPLALGAGLATVMLALVGCSGDSATTSGAAPGGAEAAPAPGAPARDGAVAGGDSKAGTTLVTAQKVIRNATVLLEVPDVAKAAATVRTIAAGAQGVVTSEQLSSGSDVPKPQPADQVAPTRFADATIVISVPQSSLDRVLDRLSAIGTLTSRQLTSQDVTATFVDTTSRVASMKASVERIRALMAKATSITDLASLEGELSRRQTDLEAMQSQLKALEDQVAMSSVTVTMAGPGTTLREDTDWGFFNGLRNGLE
ncbi:MAG TPA: DUF4349 domain-containing protein, partial [Candidatus Lustribacter sp.]|nr:DUF4349 domain-containing protein [Candidatus Lustribacter sp.]